MPHKKYKTGVVAGAFSLIHPGYIRLFHEAADLCDVVIIALHDKENQAIPVRERKEILLSIKYVNRVFIYSSENELTKLLKRIKPDVRILGSDHKEKTSRPDHNNYYHARTHEWSASALKAKVAYLEKKFPQVHVFCGTPCSGKTFSAKEFANQRSGFVMLSVDDICRDALNAENPNEEARDMAYSIIHNLIPTLVSSGNSMIIDATYSRDIQRENLLKAISKVKCDFVLHELVVTPEKAVERFLKRENHPAKDLSSSRVYELAKEYKGWNL